MMRAPWIYSCFVLFLFLNNYSITAQPPSSNTTVSLSTTWVNNESLPNSFKYSDTDKTTVRVILFRGSLDEPEIQLQGEVADNIPALQFACGFYCNGNCTSFLFAVFIVKREVPGGPFYPQVVWSANRDHPVSNGAILNLTTTGELVLHDVNGSIVWTTKTSGRSITGLNLTDDGNLVLFGINNSMIWQSFNNPTDSLVPGQALIQGQQLIPSVSSTNWMAQKDLFSLQVIANQGLYAYVGSNPPQEYYNKKVSIDESDRSKSISYIRFLNGRLCLFILSAEPSDADKEIPIAESSTPQYMKLMPDGHLKVFQWSQESWLVVKDLLTRDGDVREGESLECYYPMACGRYGVCSGNQECSCPVSRSPRIEYFRAKNDRKPDEGCIEITPLLCNSSQDQVFIEVQNVMYFDFTQSLNRTGETCKQACASNCSCKAAVFGYYYSEFPYGSCTLLTEVFTMTNVNPINNARSGDQDQSSAFIKVQNVRSSSPVPSGPFISFGSKSRSTLAVILSSTFASVVFLLGAIGFVVYLIRKRRRAAQMEEEYIDEVLEMPTRFSYEELKPATDNFNKKLGEGGYGAVYEGTLEDGSKIAVKCLEGLGQVKKSFMAEVKSIGSIHHVNLVRLRGFCAWKSQRFLVYEFMCNGSLDRWIYHGDREHVLEWECRKKIILDVAKGLAYLHDDCRQKIIHLDIKPQNILLDSDFNAKVSDFGLSKLIDRDQPQVMTTMRGTPGYMAPEWLSLIITEKVDVYSFGIVLLETLCGRKNFDRSQPEESWHLLDVLQKCWEQGILIDMVDKYSEDMQTHGPDVVEMIKVASWCLQCDFTKRPSMSMVVKVLEGATKVDSSLDYNFTDPRLQKKPLESEKDMTQLMASIISGPR